MLTSRGGWFLAGMSLVLLAGLLAGLLGTVVASSSSLVLLGLGGLLWFLWEWGWFLFRRESVRRLVLERAVCDERGPVSTLWMSRTFHVRLRLRVGAVGDQLPYVVAADPVPFVAEQVEGETTAGGALTRRAPLEWEYTLRCPRVGLARFEGVRVEVSDLHGFFYHLGFVRALVVLPVLPPVLPGLAAAGGVKQTNQLQPPGIHRLRSPGSGSELLELRDYQPGDPPRTIAWKVSARRGKLMTRDYESEVPIRCTLFLDTSSSVRLPSGADPFTAGKAIDRLVELAAGVLQASNEVHDPVGLCLFDENGSTPIRPARGRVHVNRLLQMLAGAAGLGPVLSAVDGDTLTPLAYSLAQDLYPDLLAGEVNALPLGMAWWATVPTSRRSRGVFDFLYRYKRTILFLGTGGVPLLLGLIGLALVVNDVPDDVRDTALAVTIVLSPLAFLTGWGIFLFCLLRGGSVRKLARWRKRLAALLSARQGLAPGGLGLLLEDDEAYSRHVQGFLAEHQVPFAVPLYDAQGRYLFACPGKVGVLAGALLRMLAHGRDNELFVLLVDLLELDGQIPDLLRAVQVARARHHQVVIVAPWPPGLPPPDDRPSAPPAATSSGRGGLSDLLTALTRTRYTTAYERIRRAFARLGVPVVCAASEQAVPLILERMDHLRPGLETMMAEPNRNPPGENLPLTPNPAPLSRGQSEVGTLPVDFSDRPPVAGYLVASIVALLIVAGVLGQDGWGWWGTLPTVVGIVALLMNWTIGQPLVLILVVVLSVVSARLRNPDVRFPAWVVAPEDVLLASAVLVYLSTSLRLLAITRQLFPTDPRIEGRPKRARRIGQRWLLPGSPRKRHAESVDWEEVVRVLVTAPVFVLVAVGVWFALLDQFPDPEFGFYPGVWYAVLLIAGFGVVLILADGARGYANWTRRTRTEGVLYLQDQLWRDTRADQARIHAGRVRDRERRKRR